MAAVAIADVVILGGGLAGQTLARQLARAQPDLRVVVVERHTFPVPEAAFKVGESTVELSAYYFRDVLDLKAHLDAAQIRKLGLRYFFPAGDNRDLARRVEVGGVDFPAVDAYQLDRGRLENHLAEENRRAGVEVLDGTRVDQVKLSDGAADHEITISSAPTGRGAFSAPARQRALSTSTRQRALGPSARQRVLSNSTRQRVLRTRWVIDASGRAGLLRRRLELGSPVTHEANASWWRIAERVAVDDWSTDPSWRARVPSGRRWHSTNHLMGRGYWVWLIPLASDSTSFGIVGDARLHPFDRLSTFERSLDWLRAHEPQCAEVVEAKRHLLQDFHAYKHYAYGCTRVFSSARWALSGEAGLFSDPFYSPGSDFIALGNSFITDLIARERRGEPIDDRVERFNALYLLLFDAVMQLFEGQYPLMGNAQVMTAKVVWDNSSYWGFTALLFFHGKYTDLEFMDRIAPQLKRFVLMHRRMQAFLRRWDEVDRSPYADAHVNLLGMDFMYRLQSSLQEPLDERALAARLDANLDLLAALASEMGALAPGSAYAGRSRAFAEPADAALAAEIRRQLGAINLSRLATVAT